MPVLSFFPSEAHLITDSYNFVVDALFGFKFRGNNQSFVFIFHLKLFYSKYICYIELYFTVIQKVFEISVSCYTNIFAS